MATHSITHEDSVQVGYFQPKPKPSSPVSPLEAACTPGAPDCPTLVSADPPSLFQGYEQPGPVTVNFSGPVGAVSVVGNGAIECDGGTYGTLVAYNAGGTELGRVDLHLIDPSDCSPPSNPDNVTYGATGTVYATQAIAKAVILPMTPLTFLVGSDTGHASATYTVYYGRTPRLMIVPSTTSAAVGDTVWYGTQVSSIGGTIAISSWRWDADTGYVPPPGAVEKLSAAQCGANTACGHTPLVPGTMWVFGTVNGNPDSASVHVNVVPCPTPLATRDTILDNPLVRKLMRQAWDSSNYSDPVTSNRRERGGYVWRLPDGTIQVSLYTSSSDSPCTSALIPTSPFPGVPLGQFHVHPFKHLDVLPANCPITNRKPGLVYKYDAKKYGGPSGADFDRLANDSANFNAITPTPPFPAYVIDSDNIYRYAPGTTRSNWKTHVVGYTRNDTAHGCVRP